MLVEVEVEQILEAGERTITTVMVGFIIGVVIIQDGREAKICRQDGELSH